MRNAGKYVAQIFNLLCRRFVIGSRSSRGAICPAGWAQQIKNLRYGRLQICGPRENSPFFTLYTGSVSLVERLKEAALAVQLRATPFAFACLFRVSISSEMMRTAGKELWRAVKSISRGALTGNPNING